MLVQDAYDSLIEGASGGSPFIVTELPLLYIILPELY